MTKEQNIWLRPVPAVLPGSLQRPTLYGVHGPSHTKTTPCQPSLDTGTYARTIRAQRWSESICGGVGSRPPGRGVEGDSERAAGDGGLGRGSTER